MSQLFDALQKSESHRTKQEGVVASGPELLDVAEKQFQENRSQSPSLTEPGQRESEPLDQVATIPVAVAPNEKLVCVTDRQSLAAEKFRFLSLRLSHLQQKRNIKVLLITSSMAEEGKSMIAANLACALADGHGQKVLLIEGDLRRPTLVELFGLAQRQGIGDYLQEEKPLRECIYELKGLGVSFLPVGNAPEDPLVAMQSEKLTQLMDQSRAYFDWVVIDSPPLLPLGDTSAWMRLIDGILLIARPGKTAKKQLERGLEALDQSKLIGAIINDSHDVDANDYYHYYGTSTSRKSLHTVA